MLSVLAGVGYVEDAPQVRVPCYLLADSSGLGKAQGVSASIHGQQDAVAHGGPGGAAWTQARKVGGHGGEGADLIGACCAAGGEVRFQLLELIGW